MPLLRFRAAGLTGARTIASNAATPGLFGRRRTSTPAGLGSSDHFDGKRFFNPGVDTDRGFGDLLRWRRERRPAAWPQPRAGELRRAVPPRPSSGEMLLTFIGQSTVLIQTESCTLLTDPIFSDRASPVGFAGPRRMRPPGLALAAMPKIDIVLLSHNHYDHMDLRSLAWLDRHWWPLIVTGLGNGRVLRRAGLERVVELDWWDRAPSLPVDGIEVTFVPAQHWSSRTGFDRRRSLWGGHVIRTPAGTLFFAGDSGYGPHFAEIGRRFAIDLALLPIGAYEPRWFMQAQHMNPDDAVMAHADLKARQSHAVHWGTFRLTDEAIDAPLEALAVARAARGLEPGAFTAPGIGETVCWRGAAGRA
ncbi:MAG TPA: MBL fold metallo-hydrolase [Lichenihabitans sp.]|nr:MBL fold metallo-hydrolase [Lichenihabitans sp.]